MLIAVREIIKKTKNFDVLSFSIFKVRIKKRTFVDLFFFYSCILHNFFSI